MILLSAERSDEEACVFSVTSEELAGVTGEMYALLEVLQTPGVSPVDPRRVLDALRCAREGRTILPGHQSDIGIGLYPQQTVPVPLHVWARLAWMPVSLLGVQRLTRLALNDMRIFYVGTLLLHTEDELARRCDAATVEDVKLCLNERGLRLPTAAELAAANEAGFWVELPDTLRGKAWNLRVAREFAGLEPIDGLFHLSGSHPGFFKFYGIITLGDLLNNTAVELRKMWQDYIIGIHTFWKPEREQELPQSRKDELLEEADLRAGVMIAWVAAAELKFAA